LNRLNKNQKSLHISIILLAMGALLFPSAAFSEGVPESSVKRDELTTENFNNLKTKAEKDDTVRVIVGLSTSFEAEGTMDYSNVQAQKSRINQEQGSLLNYLSSSEADKIHKFEHVPFIAMTVDKNTLDRLQSSSLVATISEDVLQFPTLVDSVPLIGAPPAWSSGFSGLGQAVAILDTGVDNAHSAFAPGRIIEEACYSTTAISVSISLCPGDAPSATGPNSALPCTPSTSSDCNHGTHVAGIVAGNDATITGVAKDVDIIAIQVFSSIGNPLWCPGGVAPCIGAFSSDVIKGLDRVATLASPPHNIDISSVNLSLGSGGYSSAASCDAADPSTKAAVDNLKSMGIATIASAGNSGFTSLIGTPACISSVVSVGSTTKSDVVSSFSNSANYLDLLAPGELILSSAIGGYAIGVGTSMSAAHVTGSWAILKSGDPGATVDDVLNSLKNTGVSITDTRNGLTFPRIQVDDALDDLGVVTPPTGNLSPVADAGPPQTVTEGDLVTLDGSGSSDPDGTITAYSWIQTGGASATLSNPNISNPTFTAPTVPATDTLTFDLTVTDNDGATATASTSVTVNPSTPPPPDTTPPVVSIWKPKNGDIVVDTTQISIYSIDDDPNPVNVCYSIDGVELECKLMGAGKADIHFFWDTTTFSDGSHSIGAISCDPSGNCTTASTVTVVVDNIGGDTTPPKVSIWNPRGGDIVADTTKISVYSSDDDPNPVNVCYSIDGVELECKLMGAGKADIHFLWDTTTFSDGSHNISAESCDPSGNCTTASTVTVVVDNIP